MATRPGICTARRRRPERARAAVQKICRSQGDMRMVTVTVCVGSSCHLKGAREVIERFNELLNRRGLTHKVTLKGSFCMERCGEGVNWQIDDEQFSSENADDAVKIFRKKVLEPMSADPAQEAEGNTTP